MKSNGCEDVGETFEITTPKYNIAGSKTKIITQARRRQPALDAGAGGPVKEAGGERPAWINAPGRGQRAEGGGNWSLILSNNPLKGTSCAQKNRQLQRDRCLDQQQKEGVG